VFDPDAQAKFLTVDKGPIFEAVVRQLEATDSWGHDAIAGAFDRVMELTGLKLGKIGPSVRVALVGGTTSPSIYEVIEVLGRDETLSRLRRALQYLV